MTLTTGAIAIANSFGNGRPPVTVPDVRVCTCIQQVRDTGCKKAANDRGP